MTLDHLEYLRSRPYRRAAHAQLRKLGPGLQRMTVAHEADGSCCEVEAWELTLARLVRAVNADGLRALGVRAS